MDNNREKKPIDKREILRRVVFGAALLLVLASLTQLASEYADRKNARKEYESLAELAKQTTKAAVIETEPETAKEETEAPYVSPIDFEALRAINPEVAAWVEIPGTNINYPVVWTTNNEIYLNTDFEGNESAAGAVFLDCDSQSDLLGRHNILYGHNMRDGSMFKDIVKFKEEDFFKEHRDAYIYTPDRTIHLKTIAALYGDDDGMKRKTRFESQESFDEYVDQMTEACGFREEPGKGVERLYSFVTCSYEFDDARTILYAVEAEEEGS